MSSLLYISKRLNDIIVEGPYHVWFTKGINSLIPAVDRKYRQGIWYIHARWYPLIRQLAKNYYIHFSDTVDPDTCPSPPDGWRYQYLQWVAQRDENPRESHDKSDRSVYRSRLFVTADAPREVLTAAYRALVRIHHPDAGGDPHQFRLIDEAYKALKDD